MHVVFSLNLVLYLFFQEVLPIARKLGETVLKNCASKLQPYFCQALKALGTSIDEYSNVITSIYQEASAAVEGNNKHAASEHMVCPRSLKYPLNSIIY